MKIEINIEIRHLAYLVFSIAIILGISYVIAQAPNPGHDASQLGPGTFLGGGDYTFPAGWALRALGNAYLAVSSGRVGIGTESPSGRLDVAGDFVVTEGGDVGVGTTAPSEQLEVLGNVRIDGNLFVTGDGKGITCQVFSGAGPPGDFCPDCYFEDKNDVTSYPACCGALDPCVRYLITNDFVSVTHRCRELGYEWGYPTDVFRPAEWCGTYCNAATKTWRGNINGWSKGGCANYAVKQAVCCRTN
jgi:hypothetical protein